MDIKESNIIGQPKYLQEISRHRISYLEVLIEKYSSIEISGHEIDIKTWETVQKGKRTVKLPPFGFLTEYKCKQAQDLIIKGKAGIKRERLACKKKKKKYGDVKKIIPSSNANCFYQKQENNHQYKKLRKKYEYTESLTDDMHEDNFQIMITHHAGRNEIEHTQTPIQSRSKDRFSELHKVYFETGLFKTSLMNDFMTLSQEDNYCNDSTQLFYSDTSLKKYSNVNNGLKTWKKSSFMVNESDTSFSEDVEMSNKALQSMTVCSLKNGNGQRRLDVSTNSISKSFNDSCKISNSTSDPSKIPDVRKYAVLERFPVDQLSLSSFDKGMSITETSSQPMTDSCSSSLESNFSNKNVKSRCISSELHKNGKTQVKPFTVSPSNDMASFKDDNADHSSSVYSNTFSEEYICFTSGVQTKKKSCNASQLLDIKKSTMLESFPVDQLSLKDMSATDIPSQPVTDSNSSSLESNFSNKNVKSRNISSGLHKTRKTQVKPFTVFPSNDMASFKEGNADNCSSPLYSNTSSNECVTIGVQTSKIFCNASQIPDIRKSTMLDSFLIDQLSLKDTSTTEISSQPMTYSNSSSLETNFSYKTVQTEIKSCEKYGMNSFKNVFLKMNLRKGKSSVINSSIPSKQLNLLRNKKFHKKSKKQKDFKLMQRYSLRNLKFE